jgi:hypothetical protein
VTIEFASSTNNPAFRIYRVANAPFNLSFVRDVHGPEQLVIFDGDEAQTPKFHHETERSLQKLSEPGQRLARGLFSLPFRGIYIAIDQLQLTTRDARGWNELLHQRVVDALRKALAPLAFEELLISWAEMMSLPDELP